MKQRILIVGAGFAGMWSALAAARVLDQRNATDIEVTVLAPAAELRVRPRFYETAAGTMRAPLAELFSVTGVSFVQGSVERIDTKENHVLFRTAQGTSARLDYSKLILATGSQVVRPSLPGLAEYAFDVDHIDAADRLERHLQALPQQADSPARNTVVVVGGGLTGIETATEMPERLRNLLGEEAVTRVIIVDRGAVAGGAFGEQVSDVIREACAALDVEWQSGCEVVAIDEHGVTLADGRHIAAGTVIWTTGVRANPLAEQVPAERDAQGRLLVDDYLKVNGQADIFATGDMARALTDDEGHYALMTCQHALALGRFSGHNAAAELLGLDMLPYRQPLYVTCLDLGAWGAVYSEGWDRQVRMVGEDAKKLKKEITTQWIYPPQANRAEALAAANPEVAVVS